MRRWHGFLDSASHPMTSLPTNGIRLSKSSHFTCVAARIRRRYTLPAHDVDGGCAFVVLLLHLFPTSVVCSSPPCLLTVHSTTATSPVYVRASCLTFYMLSSYAEAEASPDKPVVDPVISPYRWERIQSLWLDSPRTSPYTTRHLGYHRQPSTSSFLTRTNSPAAGAAEPQQSRVSHGPAGVRKPPSGTRVRAQLRRTNFAWHRPPRATAADRGEAEVYHPASPLLCKVVSIEQTNKHVNDPGLLPAPEIYSIVLDHQGKLCFREGQSVGIIPQPHAAPGAGEMPPLKSEGSKYDSSQKWPPSTRRCVRPRLYSIASGRDGDDGSGSTFTLCVKKHLYRNPSTGVREPAKDGICSTYICNVRAGDTVAVSGPVGKNLLLPAEGSSPLVMLGTGTGVAPFRSHLAHIRARGGFQYTQPREIILFLGSWSEASLPYMAEWRALKAKNGEYGVDIHFAWSRPGEGQRRTYVQDILWTEGAKVWDALANKKGHLYVCGMKEMLVGVESVLNRLADERQAAQGSFVRQLKMERRWHAEVY